MKITTIQNKYEEGSVTVYTEGCTNKDNVDITIEWSQDEREYILSYPRHQLEALAMIFADLAKNEAEEQSVETEGGLLQR